MSKINSNFLNLQNNYLFVTVAKRVDEFKKKNPEKKLINLGIGDITLPLPKAVVKLCKMLAKKCKKKKLLEDTGQKLGMTF